MAIKPKSRAHEDRIKALEKQFLILESDHYVTTLEVAALRKRIAAPWYKRIFGL